MVSRRPRNMVPRTVISLVSERDYRKLLFSIIRSGTTRRILKGEHDEKAIRNAFGWNVDGHCGLEPSRFSAVKCLLFYAVVVEAGARTDIPVRVAADGAV